MRGSLVVLLAALVVASAGCSTRRRGAVWGSASYGPQPAFVSRPETVVPVAVPVVMRVAAPRGAHSEAAAAISGPLATPPAKPPVGAAVDRELCPGGKCEVPPPACDGPPALPAPKIFGLPEDSNG